MTSTRARLAQRLLALLFVLDTLPAAAAGAKPEAPADTASPWHFDLEVDPIAYALAGYSLHAGIGYEHLRLDLGAYAMALPELVHGNADFDVSFHGAGAKLQVFPFEPQSGFFVGVDAGVARMLAEQRASGLGAVDTQVSLGVNAGYRIEIAHGFYATPWLGIGYAFGAQDVDVMGSRLSAMPVTVFPAVHLGYRVR